MLSLAPALKCCRLICRGSEPTDRARRLVVLLSLLGALAAPNSLPAQSRTLEFYSFSVFAGQSGSSGNVDGAGTAARLNYPNGMALDAAGNIYLAAGDNHTIRKITAAGVVTTIAGVRGLSGSTDGPVATARFLYPKGVAVAADGTLYVADGGNDTIRKITTDGVVSTLAGRASSSGSTDGLGASARFDQPTDLVLDSAGNLFVTDFSNHTIRKITPEGQVSTFAGLADSTGSTDGTGSAARFFDPHGLCIDSAGNLFVADRWNNLVRKITPAGVVTTVAGLARSGGNVDAIGNEARFSSPEDVAVDAAGILYVLEWGGSLVRKITPDGMVSTLAGKWNQLGSADGTGTNASFRWPRSIVSTPQGTLFVTDENHTIRRGVPDAASAITITTQPATTAVALGSALSLSVGATGGGGSLTYQWRKDGTTISGATNATYTLATATASSGGNYTVLVRGVLGAIASNGATVTVGASATVAPQISSQPATQSVSAGGQATFAVTATGTPSPTYQWLRNGVAVSGATNASLALTNVQASQAGSYTVVVSNSAGSRTSNPATLTVVSGPTSRLSNLSVRTTLTNGQLLIVGLTMGEGAKPVLARAVGPTLAAFGLTNALPDPKLEIFDGGGTKVDENDDWAAGLGTTFSRLGAFALSAGSKDAALTRTISGGHTAQLRATASGVALVEVYDAGTGNQPRLTNLSARNQVGTGSDILIAGFTIDGTGTKQVLIRGVGPSLAAFGLTGFLADPKIEVIRLSDGQKVAENDDWSSTTGAAFSRVGAFALTPGSRDAALLATLPAGGYTVQVSGVGNTTGEAIVEVYEIP